MHKWASLSPIACAFCSKSSILLLLYVYNEVWVRKQLAHSFIHFHWTQNTFELCAANCKSLTSHLYCIVFRLSFASFHIAFYKSFAIRSFSFLSFVRSFVRIKSNQMLVILQSMQQNWKKSKKKMKNIMAVVKALTAF